MLRDAPAENTTRLAWIQNGRLGSILFYKSKFNDY